MAVTAIHPAGDRLGYGHPTVAFTQNERFTTKKRCEQSLIPRRQAVPETIGLIFQFVCLQNERIHQIEER